jgi:DNA primase
MITAPIRAACAAVDKTHLDNFRQKRIHYLISFFVGPAASCMNNFAETVRNSADIVQVVSEYVTLKGAGTALKALCPFHSEKTPSFSVHREKQVFHCFGCGAGGDVFEFVKRIENVSFPEALRIVAGKFGVPIPANTGFDERKAEEKNQLLETNERAVTYFRQALSSEQAALARQVLHKRQIATSFVEKFQLGYAPQSGLLGMLRPKDPVSTGLFVKNDRGEVYDRFRHRLMFPIWNERGKPIAFGGRALGDAEPKYLNSPETTVYTKSSVLYALHFARETAQKTGRIVVVEGYFDCLSLHQNGIENVVASCGTSLTAQQVSLMSRFAPEIVMNYDPDTAGQNAMRRSIDLLLAKGLRIRILHLPERLDPDDFIRKHGSEVYNKLLANAPYFWQYLMTEGMKQYDMNEPAMKANAIRDVLQFVAKIQDRVERLEVAKVVAEGFKVPEAILFEQLGVTAGRREARPGAASGFTASRAVKPTSTLTPTEKQLIHALLQDRAVARNIEPFLTSQFLTEAWSFPVIAGLVQNPIGNVEDVLGSVNDEELRRQVRATVFEPFGRITAEEALASIAQLYDAHLVKKEREIREQLKQYGSGAAPAELVRQQMEIAAEKSRIKSLKS